MDKILLCDLWNETSSAVFSHGKLCFLAVYKLKLWSFDFGHLCYIVKGFVLHDGENPLAEAWKNKNCLKMSLAKSMQWNVD